MCVCVCVRGERESVCRWVGGRPAADDMGEAKGEQVWNARCLEGESLSLTSLRETDRQTDRQTQRQRQREREREKERERRRWGQRGTVSAGSPNTTSESACMF